MSQASREIALASMPRARRMLGPPPVISRLINVLTVNFEALWPSFFIAICHLHSQQTICGAAARGPIFPVGWLHF